MKRREPERTIHSDLSHDDDCTGYLKLDRLSNAQAPLSDPPHHDELNVRKAADFAMFFELLRVRTELGSPDPD